MPGRSRRRSLAPVTLVALCAVAASVFGGAQAARGQVTPLPGDTTTSDPGATTSTTEARSTTTTTGTTIPGITPTSSSTTTTIRSGSSTTSTSSTSTSSTSTSSTTTPTTLPPGAAEIINSVHRTPPNSTAKLLAALQPLVDAGMTQEQAVELGFGRFPVGGLVTFSDDWLMPRFTGTFHFHHGTDVFAAGGTPARAPADGVLRLDSDPLGGTSAYVTETDGTYYYLTHLAGYAPGVVSGQRVKAGDVVAFVGNTGDAAGGPTHCHFEIHPKGGEAVDPKPFLDQWIADALAAAPGLVAAFTSSHAPLGSLAAGPGGVLVAGADMFAGPAVPARSQLLWATSASPAGGALQLAAAEATEAARSVDWMQELRRQQLEALEWNRVEGAAAATLAAAMPAGARVFIPGFAPVARGEPDGG